VNLASLPNNQNYKTLYIYMGVICLHFKELKLCNTNPHILRSIGGSKISEWVVLDFIESGEAKLLVGATWLFEKIDQFTTWFPTRLD